MISYKPKGSDLPRRPRACPRTQRGSRSAAPSSPPQVLWKGISLGFLLFNRSFTSAQMRNRKELRNALRADRIALPCSLGFGTHKPTQPSSIWVRLAHFAKPFPLKVLGSSLGCAMQAIMQKYRLIFTYSHILVCIHVVIFMYSRIVTFMYYLFK